MLYPDALAAAAQLNQGRRYHQLDQIEVVSHPYYTQAGRPRKGQAPDGYHYRLQGTVTLKSEGVIKSDGVKRSPSRRLRINWASLQLRQGCALVFQCFQSIHLVIFDGVQQIVNLTQEHQGILQFLGAPCQKYYLLV